MDPSSLSAAVTKQWDGLTLESLQVGALVQARITNVLKVRALACICCQMTSMHADCVECHTPQCFGLPLPSLSRRCGRAQDGLVVAFLTFFSGTIDKFHLTQQLAADDWATKYSAGQKLLARILYVDPTSKRVGLTLAKHLLEQVRSATSPAALGVPRQQRSCAGPNWVGGRPCLGLYSRGVLTQ